MSGGQERASAVRPEDLSRFVVERLNAEVGAAVGLLVGLGARAVGAPR